jgi:PKD repeat protein
MFGAVDGFFTSSGTDTLEDFERTSPLDDYSGSKGDFTIQSTISVSGSALQKSQDPDARTYVVRDSPVTTIESGKTYEAKVYADSSISNGTNPQVLFFAASTANGIDGYNIYYDEDGTFYIARLDDTALTILEQTSCGTYTDRFVTLRIIPDDGGSGLHTAELVVDGTVDTSLTMSSSDTTYTSGSYGFGARRDNSYFDDLLDVSGKPSASFTYSPSNPTTGESVSFDGTGSSDPDGSISSYSWDFQNDGTEDATGSTASHTYSSSGDYTAALTVTDDGGATDTSTQTVSVSSATASVTEDFETDLSAWTINTDTNGNPGLQQVTDRPYAGTYAGFIDWGVGNSTPNASRTLFSGGAQPATIEFYWQEDSNSSGHAVRFVNSNGNYELSATSNNPQWEYEDSGGITEVYSGDGYDRWIYVTITPDWANGTFDGRWEDLTSGTVQTISGATLISGVDIETIEVGDYSGGSFYGTGSCNTWFDDIYASE